MARVRRNRRKGPKRELPKLPAIAMPAINWRPLLTVGLLLGVGAVSFGLGRELLELPVRKLDIQGPFQRVTENEIITAAQPALVGSLLTLDLTAIRRRVTSIDWVDTVTLQRIWPDTLRISYREHLAAASWGRKGLLNTRGELFADDLKREYLELPVLIGPDGSHQRVAEQYLKIRDRLTQAGLSLGSVEMDERGAFTFELDGGPSVRIGREDIDGRTDRFFRVAVPSLAEDLGRADYIDLRYPNGFAVAWRESAAIGTTLARAD
jgi:cell division protein FtsQ